MKFTHRAMDTVFTLAFGKGVLDSAICEGAASAVFARIDELETLLSRFNDVSDVAVIRSLKPGDTAVLAPETMRALLVSVRVCAATKGAFDPTLAPVMNRIRKQNGDTGDVNASPFATESLWDAFARTGMNRLVLDVENLRIAVKPDRLGRGTPVELDFGGVGKGLALDICRELLEGEQFDLHDWMLDAGTSTQWAAGLAPDGLPWRFGVGGNWKTRTHLETVLPLSNKALSGSGFEIQGAHIINPRKYEAFAKGKCDRCVATHWSQAWAIAKEAALADALTTASLSLSSAELMSAASDLDAQILVARNQKPLWDRIRDPLRWFGNKKDET